MSKHGLRISKTELDALIAKNPGLSIDGAPAPTMEPAPVAEKVKLARGMNKTEAAYAAILEAQKERGEIREWAYEPFKLRYGTGAFYKPDFVVGRIGKLCIAQLASLANAQAIETASSSQAMTWMRQLSKSGTDGIYHFRIIEIKGGHIFDAAKPRFKAAQLRYPWAEFQMIQRRNGEFVRIL